MIRINGDWYVSPFWWALSLIFIFYFGYKGLIWLDENKYVPKKIEPNYPSLESAMKACWEANKKLLNDERVKELFEIPSNLKSSYKYDMYSLNFSFERKLLSEQCEVVKTRDRKVGRIEGSFSFLEKKYDDDGKFLKATPTVVTKSNRYFEEDVYFPYKESWEKRDKFIYDYTKN